MSICHLPSAGQPSLLDLFASPPMSSAMRVILPWWNVSPPVRVTSCPHCAISNIRVTSCLRSPNLNDVKRQDASACIPITELVRQWSAWTWSYIKIESGVLAMYSTDTTYPKKARSLSDLTCSTTSSCSGRLPSSSVGKYVVSVIDDNAGEGSSTQLRVQLI
jgi:hypothetical protein